MSEQEDPRFPRERFWDVAELVKKYGANTYADYETWLLVDEKKREAFVKFVTETVNQYYDYMPEEFRRAVRDLTLALEGIEGATKEEVETAIHVIGDILTARWVRKSGLGGFGSE